MTACPAHPNAEAVGTCERCGRFFCAAEQVALDGKRFCGECGHRDDVDWLGAHYRPLIGKRSGFAWASGIIALALSTLVISVLVAGLRTQLLIALGIALFAAAQFAFFSGAPWGRAAPFAAVPLCALCFGLSANEAAAGIGMGVLALLYAGAGWTDVRSKLFFRVEVPRPALHKHFRLYGNNPLAVIASRLAFVSLLVPGLSLVALGLGVAALMKVDRRGTPPVTNIGTAVGAIVFSLLTTAFWGFSLLSRR